MRFVTGGVPGARNETHFCCYLIQPLFEPCRKVTGKIHISACQQAGCRSEGCLPPGRLRGKVASPFAGSCRPLPGWESPIATTRSRPAGERRIKLRRAASLPSTASGTEQGRGGAENRLPT